MAPDPQRQALSAAAHWLARLAAAPGDPELQQAFRAWHQQNPQHQWAWQRVEQLQAQLGSLPPTLAGKVLDPARLDRRTVLKGLGLGVGASWLGWSGYRQAPVWLADQRTAVGERRTLQLADGSRLSLDTDSAVDIRYSPEVRLLTLRAGAILIETAQDPRPFIVRSAEGDLRALGTRFSVRQDDGLTTLSVLQHAVAVRPSHQSGETVVNAGQAVTFDSQHLLTRSDIEPGAGEWSQGRLLVDGWRLDHLLAELQRYRHGYLGCDPQVAHLRVSGAYPLDDSERALAAIARALPVRIVQRTRFWTRLVAA
ncbi:iron dicitrate transport regulator FecR [Pseudomonas chlororaphis]|jgi:transmembrane sensor|uniref:FecR domain-containing protein n=1 Tax=Pseudomonas morbosilactucae TaxID=2938197 RepID=A0ABT0JH70_9PSED|nr:FecR domain-containing protein [Pseudomonas morbosilactucae]MCK9815268.1 FecR domain-containing protein [Pseudomonas morbosilactucae]ROL65812.1 iron dicitrate transport regulator FecR [Pseudomonas chlororaphis]WEK08390.1 MAG: FecR domain-containing protein [Pseudomonas sp.]